MGIFSLDTLCKVVGDEVTEVTKNIKWGLSSEGDKGNPCPKMADRASERVPVLAPGLFRVLLPAPLRARTKSAKYAEGEVHKLPPLFVLGLRPLEITLL